LIPEVKAERERLGYPTQKPVTLLERIIATSSNEGDIIPGRAGRESWRLFLTHSGPAASERSL
jgi:hypothetical protein